MKGTLKCPHCESGDHPDCVWKERVAVVGKIERWIVRNYDKQPETVRKALDEVLSELSKLLK